MADSFLNNSPLNNQFVVGAAGAAPLSPNVANNQAAQAAAANASFVQGFASGQTLAEIQAENPLFVTPSFYNAAHSIQSPQYQEWNLEFQQGFGKNTTLSLNYVGNHGIHEAVQNAGLNAFGFGTLPATAIDPRFGTITEVGTVGVSNYNGLTISARHQFSSLQV